MIHQFSAPASRIKPHDRTGDDKLDWNTDDKGECNENPTLEERPPKGTWACNRVSDGEKGNYIRYQLPYENSREILRLDQVNTEYCDPKPANCHCKTLLGSLLRAHLDVKKISFHFAAKPFVAGCKCYLGEAERLGFNNVQVLPPTYMIFDTRKKLPKACTKERKLTAKNYPSICAIYEDNECSGIGVDWAITKRDAAGDQGCKICKR